MKPFYVICLTLSILASLLLTSASAVSYTYDPAGRLTKVTYDDGATIRYSYDNTGRLLQRVMSISRNLSDAIRILQMLAAIEPSAPVEKAADVNADDKIGLEEAIYILQKISEVR